MASETFVNYPRPQKAADCSYNWKQDNNPVVRGLPLAVAAAAVTNIGYVSRYLWQNTGFDKVKDLPCLVDEVPTLRPLVVPTDTSAAPASPSGPDTTEIRHIAFPDARYLSAADYHAAYLSGSVTPTDMVEALLPLVQRGRGSPYENAFLVTHTTTLRKQAAASTARYATGQPLGVLDGVPVTVKCDIPVAGYVCTFGLGVPRFSPTPMEEEEEESDSEEAATTTTTTVEVTADAADADCVDPAFARRYPHLGTPQSTTSWPVQKLLDAGVLLVAQNNMHELGMDTTGCNPSTGTPINWHNKDYYPGGSSSGAGSALGAGLVPIAVGTDAGGSVRVPTSFNGVFGLKTTQDRFVSMASSMCVIGPMAATVADLKAAYRTMAQPDVAGDPVGGRFVPGPAIPSPCMKVEEAGQGGQGGQGGRRTVIAIPRAWVDRADAAVRRQFDTVVAFLRDKRGYEVVDDVALPLLFEGQAAHAPTCLVESIAGVRAHGAPADLDGWRALVNAQNRVLLGVAQHATGVDMVAYAQLRTVLMRHLAWVFREQFRGADGTVLPRVILLTPTTPRVGWPKHPADAARGLMDGNMSLLNMLYVWLANTTGCPSVSGPMGYAEPVATAADRTPVPMGIMAVGEWGAEETLLTWAADVEEYLHTAYPGGRRRPAAWVDVLARANEAKEAKEGGK